MDLLRSR